MARYESIIVIILMKNSDVQIKLKFPAILRYRRKGPGGKWDTL